MTKESHGNTPRKRIGAIALAAAAAVGATALRAASAAQPAAPGASAAVPAAGETSLSVPRPLLIPVEGTPPSALHDMFNERRGSEGRHEAIDILAPRGTRVFAVDDGRLVKLFTSKPGGLTIYQFDSGERFAYYYAHLDRYAEGLKEGMKLSRGDLIGYVGTTGNAPPDTPHLHFAVFRLGPERQWWKGTPVNPYPLLVPAAAPAASQAASR